MSFDALTVDYGSRPPPTVPIDALAFPEPTKKYLKDTFDPIMMEMVEAVFEAQPEQPLEFVISWLRKRSSAREEALSLKEQNARLKKDFYNTRSLTTEIVDTIQKDEVKSDESEEEEEESEEDEDADIEAAASEAMRVKAAQRGPRQSVSAEAYGDWNVKKTGKAPEFPKSDEQKARLRKILAQSFLFNALPDKELDIIIRAMQEKLFSPGDRIITEGEDGFDVFVIEQGSPECKKLIDGKQVLVKTCVPGDVFGELALLYNTPRAATVETSEKCVCWRLDRETFNSVVREAAIKRTEKYNQFLQQVPLLSGMDINERNKMIDSFKCEVFKEGDCVVTQGEAGDRFFLVEEGTLVAMKRASPDAEPRNVFEYSMGMYFGELALIRNQPRAASVIVTSKTAKVVSVDKKCFNNLVGSVSEILHRRINEYA